MDNGKEFLTTVVISIVSGKMLVGNIVLLKEALGYMCGEIPYTTQYRRFANECKPYIRNWCPELFDIDLSNLNKGNWQEFARKIEEEYGRHRMLYPIPMDDHDVKFFIDEAIEDYPSLKSKIIGIDLDGDSNIDPIGDIGWKD